MGAEPFTSGDPAMFADLPDDLFGPVGNASDEAEFWTEADQARHGSWATPARTRRHRRADRKAAAGAAPATAAATSSKRSLWGRLGAAWAAESSARRALRFRPGGSPEEPKRGRKIATAAIAVVALLALGVAGADLLTRDRQESDEAIRDESAGLAPMGEVAADAASDDAETDGTVPSKVIDAPRSEASTKAKTKTTTKAKPKATTPAAKPATTTPARPKGASPAVPTPTSPPATAVPTTATPQPATPTTAAPTTAPPPAKPAVKAFTATAASAPGGSCPALQWATTLKWDTTAATTVAITGLLEQTQSSLPADGTTTVCRALPGGPLGGWTLTATGPGGTATATA